MNVQQTKTLLTRVHVARDIATEKLLTAIAKEPLFANVPSNELVAAIVGANSFNEDTQADMLAYLMDKRHEPLPTPNTRKPDMSWSDAWEKARGYTQFNDDGKPVQKATQEAQPIGVEEWAQNIGNNWAQLEQSRVDEHVADVQLNQRLRAENVTLRQELEEAKAKINSLTHTGWLIEWAIETSKVWLEFVNSTDVDAPPSQALCDTLNVLTEKVKKYKQA